jgi:PKD domain
MSRRAWLTAVATLGLMLCPAATATGQAQSCQQGTTGGPAPGTAGGVNIHVTRTNTVIWCSAAVIDANTDVAAGTDYPVRGNSGGPTSNTVGNALSISHLLGLAGISPANVNFSDVARPSGSFSTLSAADLNDPNRFQGGLPPIVWTDGTTMHYTRPLRANDPSDTNADDQLIADDGTPLDLYVRSGPQLEVAVTPSSTHVSPKTPVTFTARVSGAGSSNGSLSYSWTFGDGTTATAASPRHAFSVAGVYPVQVTVSRRSDDSAGASQPLDVTVGSPPAGRHPHTGTDKGTGVTPGSSGSKARSGQRTAHTSAPTATQPASNSPTTPSAATGASASALRAGSSRTRRAAARHRQRTRRTAPHRQSPKGLPVISGRLIADAIPVAASSLAGAARTPASASRAPAANLAGTVTPLAAIAGSCVIILLLGSGAGVELRGQRRSPAPSHDS